MFSNNYTNPVPRWNKKEMMGRRSGAITVMAKSVGKRCFPPLIYAPILTATSHRGRRLSLPENVPCISDFARVGFFLLKEKEKKTFLLGSARNAGQNE